MSSKIVGITAVLAVFVILAYAVFAANQNAVDSSQACEHASKNGKSHASTNSVLSSCEASGPVCGDGICETGEDFINCQADCPPPV